MPAHRERAPYTVGMGRYWWLIFLIIVAVNQVLRAVAKRAEQRARQEAARQRLGAPIPPAAKEPASSDRLTMDARAASSTPLDAVTAKSRSAVAPPLPADRSAGSGPRAATVISAPPAPRNAPTRAPSRPLDPRVPSSAPARAPQRPAPAPAPARSASSSPRPAVAPGYTPPRRMPLGGSGGGPSVPPARQKAPSPISRPGATTRSVHVAPSQATRSQPPEVRALRGLPGDPLRIMAARSLMSAPSKPAPDHAVAVPVSRAAVDRALANPRDLRLAFVISEILGRPVGEH